MKKINVSIAVILLITFAGCSNSGNQLSKSTVIMEQAAIIKIPKADNWVQSQLRNRLTLKLSATVGEVWLLVGDPANMPQYSEGLRAVKADFDDKGNCTGYTCFFKPMEGEQDGIEHFAKMVWHEKHLGWASMDDDENLFGTRESLSLLTLEAAGEFTIFNWEFFFNCADEGTLNVNRNGYFAALDDISRRLIKRFGGVQVENYADGGDHHAAGK